MDGSECQMKQHDRMLLIRILVTLDQSENKKVDPVTQARLVDYFRKAIVKAREPKRSRFCCSY